MSKKLTTPHTPVPASDLLIYQAADGTIKIDVRLEDETVWLTQDDMARLFAKSKKTISEHIRNIFDEGELDEQVVVRKFRTTTRHGAIEGKTQSKEVNFYCLDVIISVGYRVKSQQGVRFRIWATKHLKEYISINSGITLSANEGSGQAFVTKNLKIDR